jgi:hypothetical protein
MWQRAHTDIGGAWLTGSKKNRALKLLFADRECGPKSCPALPPESIAGGFFRRRFGGGFHHFIQEFLEFLKSRGWDDDGVASATHVFGDSQETTAWIFLERKNKSFALNLHLLRLQGVFIDRRFGRHCAVRSIAKRRRTFIRDHIIIIMGRPNIERPANNLSQIQSLSTPN